MGKESREAAHELLFGIVLLRVSYHILHECMLVIFILESKSFGTENFCRVGQSRSFIPFLGELRRLSGRSMPDSSGPRTYTSSIVHNNHSFALIHCLKKAAKWRVLSAATVYASTQSMLYPPRARNIHAYNRLICVYTTPTFEVS